MQQLATSFHVARREREAALAAARRQGKEQHLRRLGALAAYPKRVTDELEPTAPLWLSRDTWQRPDGELWTDSMHSMPSDRADTVGSVSHSHLMAAERLRLLRCLTEGRQCGCASGRRQ